MLGAGGGIRTLNPSRGLVFETSAYTVPPRRLAWEARSVHFALPTIGAEQMQLELEQARVTG